MRTSESFISAPLIVIGWIFASIVLYFLFKNTSVSDNRERMRMATVGGFVFVISSIPIPSPLPIPFNLSGMMLVLLIFGLRKGVIVGSGAMILNHVIIPGSLGALGLNLTNMLIISLGLGYIPHKMIGFERVGRRLDYIIAFTTGMAFIILDGLLVLSELSISHTTDAELEQYTLPTMLFLVILSVIEGFFTAISFSYYTRAQGPSYTEELLEYMETLEVGEDNLYLFNDEEEEGEYDDEDYEEYDDYEEEDEE
ncbi:MAG: energy-coupling factor ABC transporter permease [Candidatus Heimdallarchaeota archaeon]|nr:energy-coupling factor ABC transporter permease [Candidatus Heimdallarchaeota archaeon]